MRYNIKQNNYIVVQRTVLFSLFFHLITIPFSIDFFEKYTLNYKIYQISFYYLLSTILIFIFIYYWYKRYEIYLENGFIYINIKTIPFYIKRKIYSIPNTSTVCISNNRILSLFLTSKIQIKNNHKTNIILYVSPDEATKIKNIVLEVEEEEKSFYIKPDNFNYNKKLLKRIFFWQVRNLFLYYVITVLTILLLFLEKNYPFSVFLYVFYSLTTLLLLSFMYPAHYYFVAKSSSFSKQNNSFCISHSKRFKNETYLHNKEVKRFSINAYIKYNDTVYFNVVLFDSLKHKYKFYFTEDEISLYLSDFKLNSTILYFTSKPTAKRIIFSTSLIMFVFLPLINYSYVVFFFFFIVLALNTVANSFNHGFFFDTHFLVLKKGFSINSAEYIDVNEIRKVKIIKIFSVQIFLIKTINYFYTYLPDKSDFYTTNLFIERFVNKKK